MSREVCKKNALHLQVAKAAKLKTWWLCCSLDVALRKEVTYRSTWTNIAKPLPQPWIVQKKTEGIVLAQPRLPANLPGPTHVDHPVGRWLWKCRCGNAAAGGLVFQDLHCYIDDEQHEGDVIVMSVLLHAKQVKVCPPQFLFHWTAIDCAHLLKVSWRIFPADKTSCWKSVESIGWFHEAKLASVYAGFFEAILAVTSTSMIIPQKIEKMDGNGK